jgi:hypothetical protein
MHHKDSASNIEEFPNREGFTRNPFVRSLFPDIATIDLATPTAAGTTSTPALVVGTSITNTTQQHVSRLFKHNMLEFLPL